MVTIPPLAPKLVMAALIADEQSLPSSGMVGVAVPLPRVRVGSDRLGIDWRSSSSIAASTDLGVLISMAAGIAAARGRAKAAEPLRPRNFLRDKSVLLI